MVLIPASGFECRCEVLVWGVGIIRSVSLPDTGYPVDHGVKGVGAGVAHDPAQRQPIGFVHGLRERDFSSRWNRQQARGPPVKPSDIAIATATESNRSGSSVAE